MQRKEWSSFFVLGLVLAAEVLGKHLQLPPLQDMARCSAVFFWIWSLMYTMHRRTRWSLPVVNLWCVFWELALVLVLCWLRI